ncbi:hypothetical protein [Bacillus mojavensis]|uniref:hypothetical protein n=1 Tax=Bacillus mojavensis TaxID=72360 RepID=UPI002DB82D48|nr:hypothetical protein [Bacillus mojavensis]MEC1615631.1 hypothetical protein [Bacillus mojavensis]MEC1622198.1 hypothetical protein [Bacillus mojavensis]MEC1660369.1 hypothetical protein [Bacillus mojavensis]MEC1685565.1 hypothetical protein [Bacillus mojavensis]MEC1693013.1 hypothetical protein [Bacillus mojavensis]
MLDKELYPCLVCGYKGLIEKLLYNGEYQKTFDICPCCGFEFGYSEDHEVKLGFIITPDHLIEAAFQLYRKQWIEAGIKIFHPQDIPTEFKNGDCLKAEVLLKQLKSLNLDIDNFEIDGFNE